MLGIRESMEVPACLCDDFGQSESVSKGVRGLNLPDQEKRL